MYSGYFVLILFLISFTIFLWYSVIMFEFRFLSMPFNQAEIKTNLSQLLGLFLFYF